MEPGFETRVFSYVAQKQEPETLMFFYFEITIEK